MSKLRAAHKCAKWINKQPGWRAAEMDGQGHYKVTGPDGQVVRMPSSPGEWRSWLNTRAKLRRAGLANVPKAF